MKSFISLLLAVLALAVFGIIGGCTSDTSPETTKKNETVTTYTTTQKFKDELSQTAESLKDDVSEKFSEAGSDMKDMMPEKENGVVTTKRQN